MKVKRFFVMFSILTCVGLLCYLIVENRSKDTNDTFVENLEALSKPSESSSSCVYTPEQYKCPGDNYKYSTVCRRGGNELCSASDCNF